MTKVERAELQKELKAALAMQMTLLRNGVPSRQCSPYGQLAPDNQRVMIIARQTRDALKKAIKANK